MSLATPEQIRRRLQRKLYVKAKNDGELGIQRLRLLATTRRSYALT